MILANPESETDILRILKDCLPTLPVFRPRCEANQVEERVVVVAGQEEVRRLPLFSSPEST